MAPPRAVVWKKENNFSSAGQTEEVVLRGLPDGAQEPCGDYFCVRGDVKLEGKFSHPPFGASSPNNFLTDSRFDQPFAYHRLDSYVRFLDDKLGVDMKDVEVILRRKPHRSLPVEVNIPDLSNAYFSSNGSEGSLGFGDGEGKWHFASCGDIVVHEASHYVIHRINPLLMSGHSSRIAAAVHEGSADALTALYYNDMELAEDFGYWENKAADPKGLRSADNTNTVQNTRSSDPHIIGNIYSGFFWSLSGRIDRLLKAANGEAHAKDPEAFKARARIFTMRLLLAHLEEYKYPNVGYDQFVNAVTAAFTGLTKTSPPILDEILGPDIHPLKAEDVLREIRLEAKERGFTVRGGEPPFVGEFYYSPTPVETVGLYGGRTHFYPQVYRTKNSGDVEVLGHGYSIRRERADGRETTDKQGLRIFRPGEINEAVTISAGDAYTIARDAVEKKLPASLAEQMGKKTIAPGLQRHLTERMKAALQAGGAKGGRLAILPGGKGLSWCFEAGPVLIAVNATTRDVKMQLKAIID